MKEYNGYKAHMYAYNARLNIGKNQYDPVTKARFELPSLTKGHGVAIFHDFYCSTCGYAYDAAVDIMRPSNPILMRDTTSEYSTGCAGYYIRIASSHLATKYLLEYRSGDIVHFYHSNVAYYQKLTSYYRTYQFYYGYRYDRTYQKYTYARYYGYYRYNYISSYTHYYSYYYYYYANYKYYYGYYYTGPFTSNYYTYTRSYLYK